MKVVKKILKVLLIVIVLVVGLLIAAPFIFKDELIQLAKDMANENVNGKVEFGEFDLTVFSSFPDFTFVINDVSVAGEGKFEGDTLAAIEKLTIDLDLMSVISGDEYELHSLEIVKPNILAKVLADSSANWDIAPEGEEEEVVEEEDEGETEFAAKLRSLKITDGKVVYDDATMAFFMEMDGLNFDMSGDLSLDVTTLETVTSIESVIMSYEGMKYMNKTKVDIKADLEADQPNGKYTFKENEVVLNTLPLGFDGWIQMTDDDINMDVNYHAVKSEFASFLSLIPGAYTADFASVKTAGKLGLDGHVKGTYNEESLPGFGLDLLVENAMFQYPDLPQAVTDININTKIDNQSGDPDHTNINVSRFDLKLGENPIAMTLKVSTPVSDANVDATLNGTIYLGTLKDMMPLEDGDKLNGTITSDIAVKGRMSSIDNEQYEEFEAKGEVVVGGMEYASAAFPQGVKINSMKLAFTPQYLELSEYDSKIGSSDIQANGRIENYMAYTFKDEPLQGSFNMHSGVMDLNEFMEDEEEVASTEESSAEEEPLEVIEIPSNIEFNLSSEMDKLIYDNMEMNNVKGDIVIKDSKAELTNLAMNTLGGSMVVNGSYGTRNPLEPEVDFALDIKEFDIPSTFETFNTVQQLAPIAGYSTGSFSTVMNFKSILDQEMMPVMNSLTGGGKMLTDNVVVKDFTPFKKLANKLKVDKLKDMAMQKMNISFEFKDGRVFVDPFDVKVGDSKAKVSGSNGFDQTLDYVMDFAIPRKSFGSAANSMIDGWSSAAKAKGVNVNLGETVNVNALIGGTVTEPTIKTDLKEMTGDIVNDIKDQVKQKIEEKKEEVKQKVEEKVDDAKQKAKEQADKIIKDAEAKAAQIRAEGKRTADQVRKEGYANAQKIEDEAKNKFQKIAAKKTADKMRSEADKKADKIESEANTKANSVVEEAKKQAAKLE